MDEACVTTTTENSQLRKKKTISQGPTILNTDPTPICFLVFIWVSSQSSEPMLRGFWSAQFPHDSLLPSFLSKGESWCHAKGKHKLILRGHLKLISG